ncbi:NAD(P)/FAD-dependent oxidoreductase [Candidatus Stoquefichus massiliensis]|uniref:NAD(P)/FAD-dependent oxidoreductase n=1 Tax=Candidatus Stoquefichus massiliensis TaxID=1470350 RepID=UPI000486DDD5|nr:FAD-dependent oxidoreductase [Candidatus Stoquefichus massiliensis]
MLRVHNVKVKLGQTNYSKIVSQILNVREKEIKNIHLSKRSVDARRQNVHWICSFDFEVENEKEFLSKHSQVQKVKPYHYQYLPSNKQKVAVVGSGPAGLFCAYVLAMSGEDVTVIERGKKVEDRVKDIDLLFHEGILNPNSNIAFGEGGAGTFSDGKLTTGIKNPRLQYILETFVEHGAPRDILYESKPHIGTDYLRRVLINMRKTMESHGVHFLFETQMVDFTYNHQSYQIQMKSHDQMKTLEADALVLAIGHSARDTYEMLYQKGLPMQAKPFAVGLRIEQSQKCINAIQYKQSAHSPHLKAAPYKLAVQTSEGRGVYTFCMCPGGYVVPSQHEKETLCVNGMSYYARNADNANSAILVNVIPADFGDDHPLAGIQFQRQLEHQAFLLGGGHYHAPVQRVVDYFEDRVGELKEIQPSFKPGYQLANLNKLFPEFINRNLKEGLKLMNQKMPGFIDESTLLTGVEARSSAPVRILRNNQYTSEYCDALYPIGEGAGYAGGIMSAAVDGIMCAEMILGEDKHGSN